MEVACGRQGMTGDEWAEFLGGLVACGKCAALKFCSGGR